MLLIVVGLAFFQYFTSDKLALRASGAKIVTPRGRARAARHGRAPLRDGRPAEAEDRDHRHAGPERVRDRPLARSTRRSRVTDRPLEPARAGRDRGRARPRALAHREPRRADHDPRELLRHARRDADPLRHVRAACSAAAAGTANDNGPPVWLIIILVSIVVYAISYVLIRTLSRYREYAADRGAAIITGAPEQLMSALQKISSQMTLIPQQDLREVEGMNAFFIIPAKAKSSPPSSSRPTRRSRSASPRSPRSRGRWAARSRLAGPPRPGWVSATSSSGARSSPSRGDDRLFALSTARITLEAELGLKPAGVAARHLQAALRRATFDRVDTDIEELLRAAARVGRLEDRAQDGHATASSG